MLFIIKVNKTSPSFLSILALQLHWSLNSICLKNVTCIPYRGSELNTMIIVAFLINKTTSEKGQHFINFKFRNNSKTSYELQQNIIQTLKFTVKLNTTTQKYISRYK